MFKTVLFDIDGVMLSEERYFDASALTVHELLTSARFMGVPTIGPDFVSEPTDFSISTIRQQVFAGDRVLELLKNVGVNANWDMVYLVFVAELDWLYAEVPEGERPRIRPLMAQAAAQGWTPLALRQMGLILRNAVPSTVVSWSGYAPLYGKATSRDELFSTARTVLAELADGAADDRGLWNLCQATFQEWYLGDEYSGEQAGKSGFLASEYPIVDPSDFRDFLAFLQEMGVQLGIATGRPNIETRIPLQHFGWWACFRENRVSTASDVLDAERNTPSERPLSKPHPYSYLRSLNGINDTDVLLSTALPLEGIRDDVLIIGDSIADFLAAQRLGASFAAVLTGLEGPSARSKFEQLGADYVFDTVLDVKQLFERPGN